MEEEATGGGKRRGTLLRLPQTAPLSSELLQLLLSCLCLYSCWEGGSLAPLCSHCFEGCYGHNVGRGFLAFALPMTQAHYP